MVISVDERCRIDFMHVNLCQRGMWDGPRNAGGEQDGKLYETCRKVTTDGEWYGMLPTETGRWVTRLRRKLNTMIDLVVLLRHLHSHWRCMSARAKYQQIERLCYNNDSL